MRCREMRFPKTSCAFTSGMVGIVLCALLAGAGTSSASATATSEPQVLYVGNFNGVTTPAGSTFTTIQAAVDAAKKNDWILVAPGDYHETGDMGTNAPTAADLKDGWYGGVDITTPDIHLRGMDRNTVIVDGTLASASTPCSSASADQNSLNGDGRNGILIWKAGGVIVDNLTVCNFIAGSGASGNEIWWNGGYGSGKVALDGYSGSYLTTTSTYFAGSDKTDADICATCALYGIFSSNSTGGSWNEVYANNFADSGMYVGACQQVCDVTIDNAQMEDNTLGYSGTNSGGQVLIENSTFDNNKEGLDTNTALTGDPPPPQDGECPGNKATSTSVLIPGGVNSCWVFMDNIVKDNNNPNVPVEGTAGLGPTGTGMTISGGRNDTIIDNEFLDNGAWGMLFVPYPEANKSSDGKTCKGTGGVVATSAGISGISCLYDPEGDASLDNKFSGDGSFGQSTNSDVGNLLSSGKEPWNCFSGNNEWNSSFTQESGAATSADSQFMPSTCAGTTPKAALLGSNTDLDLLLEVECDAGLEAGCATGYPQATKVVMEPLPTLPSMPNPCEGVPANDWCPGGTPASVRGTASSRK